MAGNSTWNAQPILWISSSTTKVSGRTNNFVDMNDPTLLSPLLAAMAAFLQLHRLEASIPLQCHPHPHPNHGGISQVLNLLPRPPLSPSVLCSDSESGCKGCRTSSRAKHHPMLTPLHLHTQTPTPPHNTPIQMLAPPIINHQLRLQAPILIQTPTFSRSSDEN